MGTGWGWGKFYGDEVGMGTVLFTVSLSNSESSLAFLVSVNVDYENRLFSFE